MKIEYNIPTSALHFLNRSEDIVRTTYITSIKTLSQKIKSFWDNKMSYCSDKDEWMFPAVPLRKTSIAVNTRLCQVRFQLSQKATVWQKIKWFFTSGIEFIEVDTLDNDVRGGLGEGTGYDK